MQDLRIWFEMDSAEKAAHMERNLEVRVIDPSSGHPALAFSLTHGRQEERAVHAARVSFLGFGELLCAVHAVQG